MELFGQCPFVTTQKLISGKWAILILHQLDGQTKRFGQLQRDLGDITQATLTKQLRYLEEEGLVIRKVYPEVPPRVEYSLTEIGQEFHTVLEQIEVWGDKYIALLKEKG
ncbi:winged helix-turn-helix transcriptional regulator [Streptococcus moroccensis]|uniref:DNA-binding HxlR family transcriptional regulator n=1 Tax=Streptococcus moroccensis TaxID=1451356 RepID=A0ABT9YQJ3_9STRE|nr:helix-turn-helix domain-containing protein [Streptococcus moroccensis]MDQ0222263.1 DNA-binding HxlR family transcriptional regulator [Streptococcus moroccensis]